MSNLSQWASSLLFPDRNKAEFDKFVQEVNNESVEHMSFQKEIDEASECRPTFEQLSQEVIIDEVSKDIAFLKSMEGVLHDRTTALGQYSSTLTKGRTQAFDSFQYANPGSSLRALLDSFTNYMEQDLYQAKQLQLVAELRKSLADAKGDMQRRLTDYQREVASAEKEVAQAEKKLGKSKEGLEKYIRDTQGEAGGVGAGGAGLEMGAKGGGGSQSSAPRTTPSVQSYIAGSKYSYGSGAASAESPADAAPSYPTATSTSTDPVVLKMEREIREDIRALLRAIANRDQVLSASRRAYQKLDQTSKKALLEVLRKLTQKEREAQIAREEALMALEQSVLGHSLEGDEEDFISKYCSDSDCFMQSSQALSILGDLAAGGGGSSGVNGGAVGGASGALSRESSIGSSISVSSVESGGGVVVSSSASATWTDNNAAGGGSNSSAGQGGSLNTSGSSSHSGGSSGPLSGTSSTSALGKKIGNAFNNMMSNTNSAAAAQPRPTNVVYSEPKSHPPPAPLAPVVTSGSKANNSTSSSAGSVGNTTSATPTSSSSLPASSVPARPTAAQLTNDINEYLTRIFYMNNHAQLHPGYLALTQGQGLGGVNTMAVEVLSFCRAWGSKPKTELYGRGGTGGSVPGGSSTSADMTSATHAYNVPIIEAVNALAELVQSEAGRASFVACLNQFRSKQVNVGIAFGWLSAVMWVLLDWCHATSDVHSAKIVMMLSQTFYYRKCEVLPAGAGGSGGSSMSAKNARRKSRRRASGTLIDSDDDDVVCKKSSSRLAESGNADAATDPDSGGDEEDDGSRKTDDRIYLKEFVTAHPTWKDGRFWEQTLWHCVIEQLQCIPCDRAWHDMSKEERDMAVRRVHDVTFSQVMAITHSMVELKCPKAQSREFVYRMSVVHQLTESQRITLLQHLSRAAGSKAE